MTRAPRGSKLWPLAALLLVAAAGCRGSGGDAPVRLAPDARSAVSRDQALRMDLPVDLLVHSLEDSILATSADGSFRLYLRHAAEDTLIRASGAAKEILNARGWDFAIEQHFERASLLTLEMRKRPRDPPYEYRTIWFLRRGGRIVVCDGIATPPHKERLGEPLKRLCQRAAVAVGDEAEEAAPDASP